MVRRFPWRGVLFGMALVVVVAYQIRISLDTIHVTRHLDLYVPFVTEPFGDRVDERDYWQSWEVGQGELPIGQQRGLQRGEQVVAVNGKPYSGFAMYVQELWRLRHQPVVPPDFPYEALVVTAIGRDGRMRKFEFGSPNCTCGVPSLVEAVLLFLVAPLGCIIAGFAVAAWRPGSGLAWCFLGLMLSLSQLRFWAEPTVNFQTFTTPMLWTDWARVPAVAGRALAHSVWPTLLLTSASILTGGPPRARWLYQLVLFSFGGMAVVQAALAVSYSENFRVLAPLYRVVEAHETEYVVVVLCLLAVLAWVHERWSGIALGAIALAAAVTLYTSAAPPTSGEWHTYSDNTRRFEAVLPDFHRTLPFVTGCSTVAVIAALSLIRRMWALVLSVVFLSPLAVHVVANVGQYWWVAGPLDWWWRWFVFGTAAVGVVSTAVWVARRVPPE